MGPPQHDLRSRSDRASVFMMRIFRTSTTRRRSRRRSSTPSPSRSSCSTTSFACWPRAAPSTRPSRSIPKRRAAALLYALGDGQWDIPALRVLLETIIPEQAAMDGFEVEHDFPGVGRRTMLLNARKVIYEDSPTSTILLAFTRRHRAPRDRAEKESLLKHDRGAAAPEAGAAPGNASTASPTAFRSSPASCCSRRARSPRRKPASTCTTRTSA